MEDIHVVVKDAEVPEHVRETCREAAAALEQHYGRIISCRVVVSAPHRQHRTGNRHEVTVALLVPGAEIVQHHGDEDLRVAIREAFDAARRRLEEHAEQLSEKAGGQPPLLHGRLVRLRPDEGYGFVETLEGTEYFVHRDDVRGVPFEELEPGTVVHFLAEETRDPEKQPIARAVRPAGPHDGLETGGS